MLSVFSYIFSSVGSSQSLKFRRAALDIVEVQPHARHTCFRPSLFGLLVAAARHSVTCQSLIILAVFVSPCLGWLKCGTESL